MSDDIKNSLRRSLQQARDGQRIPLEQMWDNVQWYNANTGESIDMTAPDVIAFRRGDLEEARRLLHQNRFR